MGLTLSNPFGVFDKEGEAGLMQPSLLKVSNGLVKSGHLVGVTVLKNDCGLDITIRVEEDLMEAVQRGLQHVAKSDEIVSSINAIPMQEQAHKSIFADVLMDKASFKACPSQTRASGNKARRLAQLLGFKNFKVVEAQGFNSGLWVLWDDYKWCFEILKLHDQFLHLCLDDGTCKKFFAAAYVSPNAIKLRTLWAELRNINEEIDAAWCIGGDFNSTLFTYDRKSMYRIGASIDRDFVWWVDEVEISDLGCLGPYFTRRREGSESRIDCVFGNNAFIEQFPNASSYDVFEHLGKRKWHLPNRLGVLNGVVVNCFNPSKMEKLQPHIGKELEEILLQEDLLWGQKAECDWLFKETEIPNISMLELMREERKKEALKNHSNDWVYDTGETMRIALSFFFRIFLEKREDGCAWNVARSPSL
ncbi:uncharacterized protein LOC129322061 [Prosopis cineraria]|uniref:uncharacterized protein LOC129322061 n=1 Tax=Prosopis cineraria TaxID=364024 RepID=UPI00241096C1|nr:uncharacterized protein LOC129322061 [Prosopis cineraria]